MLPFFLILITSLAKPSPFPEAPSPSDPGEPLALPADSLLRGCATVNGGLASHWALPCGVERVLPSGRSSASAWFSGSGAGSSGAKRRDELGQNGFRHLDLLPKSHFGAGPEVSWVTPDRPHEDLLRQRQVAPGVGVWYSPLPSLLFVGLSANTQVSTLGETWFVNALSSEARCGLSL